MVYPHSPGLAPHRVSRTNLALNYMPPLMRGIPDALPGHKPVVRTPPEDPYLAQAKLLAAALLQPQIDAANRATEQAQRDALARQKAYEGVMGTFGNFASGLPEQVQAAYRTAGQDVSGYASGIAGAAGENSRAAAAEAAAHIAAVGAPGGVTVNPDYENTIAITGGQIPAGALAANAASAFTEMTGLRTASGLGLAANAHQQLLKDSAAEAELRQKAVDLEGTRAGEIAKQLLALHDDARQQQSVDIQQRALEIQSGQLKLANAKNAFEQAAALTDIYGTIWVVKNGKAVNTGKPATGSAAYRTTHPAAAAPKGMQKATVGGHPVTYDPNTGAYYMPGTSTPVTQAQIDAWLKNPVAGAAGTPSSQSKTMADGTVVDYNPKAPAGQRYTDPVTGKVVNPNDYKKKADTKAVQQDRAKVAGWITGYLAADPGKDPADIYRSSVGAGIAGWIVVQMLRKEANRTVDGRPGSKLVHAGDTAWDNVKQSGWAAGTNAP